MLLAESIVLITLNLVIASVAIITLSLLGSHLFRALPKRHASLVGGMLGVLAAPLLVAVTWAFSLGQFSSPFTMQHAAVELLNQLPSENSSLEPFDDFKSEQSLQPPMVQPVSSPPTAQTSTIPHGTAPTVQSPAISKTDSLPETTKQAAQVSRIEPLQLSWCQTIVILGAIVWGTGVVVCAAAAVRDLLRCSRILRCCHAVENQQLKSALQSATAEAGIGRDVPVLIARGLPAPVVIGFLRPSILLPEDTQELLSANQLHAVLMHELSHVKRNDHLVVYLTAIAKVLYWWNPMIHLASKRISELREMICDDIAAGVVDEPEEYASTIVSMAERAFAKNAGWIPLGIGQSSVSELERRVRRILTNCGDLIETNLSTRFRFVAGAVACLLFGSIAFAQIGEPKASEVQSETASTHDAPEANAPEAKELIVEGQMKRFTLSVVSTEKSHVSSANIEMRQVPDFKEEWLVQGGGFKRGTYGVEFTTTKDGQVTLQLPLAAKPAFFIKAVGYAPYYAQWGNNAMPSSLEAELDRGVSIGGIVVNEQGEPIAEATVKPNFRFKNRPGDTSALYVGTRIKTDAQGQWHYDYWPEQLHDVYVEVAHPQYKPTVNELSASLYTLKDNLSPSQRIIMEKGLSVRGRVTNAQGAPIEGALLRTKFNNDVREAKTNADGFYELGGCDAVLASIVASAPKQAMDLQMVQISQDMKNVDFVMQPGGHIRIRAIDQNGNSIPKTRVLLQRWKNQPSQNFEFGHVNGYADENGVWEWNEAPLVEFTADICPPERMELARQPFVARPQEYVFATTAPLLITGRVIDAETNEPLKDFEVTPGVRSGPAHMNWVPYNIFKGKNGEFTYKPSNDYFAHLLKVQAYGYLAEESRDIKSNEGNVEVVFKLKRGADIKHQVLSPAGEPASGAKVALGVSGSQIDVNNGDIDDSSTYAERTTTDNSGIFMFPAQSSEFQIVITHETGYAYLDSKKLQSSEPVTLIAWAKVNGVYRVAGKAVPGVQLYLNSGNVQSYTSDGPHVISTSYVVTGADGRFALERVFPGRGSIQKQILRIVGEGAKEVTSTDCRRILVDAGRTTEIDYSGKGASLHGRLLPPANFAGKPLWMFVTVDLDPSLPKEAAPIPSEIKDDDAKVNAWYVDWFKTAEGKAWQAKSSAIYEQERKLSSYNATVDKEGNFSIKDVVAGNYHLRVRPSPEKVIGKLLDGITVNVSKVQETSSLSIDVGDIQLMP